MRDEGRATIGKDFAEGVGEAPPFEALPKQPGVTEQGYTPPVTVPPEVIDALWAWIDEHYAKRPWWLSKRVLGIAIGLVLGGLTASGVAIPAWAYYVAALIFGAGVVTAKGPVQWRKVTK